MHRANNCSPFTGSTANHTYLSQRWIIWKGIKVEPFCLDILGSDLVGTFHQVRVQFASATGPIIKFKWIYMASYWYKLSCFGLLYED